MRTGIMAGSPLPDKDDVRCQREDEHARYRHRFRSDRGGARLHDDNDGGFPRDALRDGRQGVPPASRGAKIVDPNTGETLPAGEIGEFCARGYNIMKGLQDARSHRSGDGQGRLAPLRRPRRLRRNGYYKVTGRLKDMIIRGGENIYPQGARGCLYHNDRVKDVQVIGVPSKKYGEEVLRLRHTQRGRGHDQREEIKAYYKENVAFFKIPKYVWIMDEFPMTASGKIQKFVLRDMAVEKYSLQATTQ